MRKIAGYHLLVDGYVVDGASLNPDSIISMFDRLVEVLGMQYCQRPTAVRVPLDPTKLDTDEDEGGWSVIAQITTSHMSLHGWPMRGAFMMDVFSCCEFNPRVAEACITESLNTSDLNIQFIRRFDPRN